MKISSGETILLNNNLWVGEDALIWNDGSFVINNHSGCILGVNTILDGNGVFFLNGNSNCTLEGEGAAFSSLHVSVGGTFYVKDDLAVTELLTLESGVVDVAEGRVLQIQNSSEGSIVFEDDYANNSFIEGTLSRNTISGNNYFFPVGESTDGFHPCMLHTSSSSGYLNVTFLHDFSSTWREKSNNGIEVDENFGGWQIVTPGDVFDFSPSFSLYSSAGFLSKKAYSIFYAKSLEEKTPVFSLDYNSIINGNNYLESYLHYKSGYFSVNTSDTIGNEDSDSRLVNFLPQNGTGRSTFEIPGREYYKRIILTVFDRFGNKIYESNNYANDFDARNYEAGTYFYDLKLIDPEDQIVLKRNIIEIVEYE